MYNEINGVDDNIRTLIIDVYTGNTCPRCKGTDVLANDNPNQGYYRCLSCNETWTVPIAVREAVKSLFGLSEIVNA